MKSWTVGKSSGLRGHLCLVRVIAFLRYVARASRLRTQPLCRQWSKSEKARRCCTSHPVRPSLGVAAVAAEMCTHRDREGAREDDELWAGGKLGRWRDSRQEYRYMPYGGGQSSSARGDGG